MRRIYGIIIALITLSAVKVQAQITVTGCVQGSANGSYTRLVDAINQIGTNQPAANILITVTASTYEGMGFTIQIRDGNWSSMTIQPSGGAWTITGSSHGTALIEFAGADNVTINGLNAGGNSLTIINDAVSSLAGTSTLKLFAGSTNNTITNCSIFGAFAGSAGTDGGTIFFGSDGVTGNGNDNNTISNCNIGPVGAFLPTKGIYMSGTISTIANANSGNTVTNNNIFDYFGAAVSSSGIYISTGNTDNNITNNKFYQTSTRTQTTTGSQHSAIWIHNTAGNNFQISGNVIGYASNTGTGIYSVVFPNALFCAFVPISLTVGTTTATSVQGNTIKEISISGQASGSGTSAPFRGIFVGSGLTSIGDVTGNTIGDMSTTGSITFTSTSSIGNEAMGIYNVGSSNWITNNNNIGGITVSNSVATAIFSGLRYNPSLPVTWTADNNTIGGTVANSIQSTTTTTNTTVRGIAATVSNSIITGNLIRNLTVAGGHGTGAQPSIAGILFSGSSVNNTLTNNIIHTLSNTNPTSMGHVTGIVYNSSSGTNLISGNLIHSLKVSSAAASHIGIYVNAGTSTYQNNMIRLGIDASGGIITTGAAMKGINEAGGTNNFYFNSVYIGGQGVNGSANTHAFLSTVTTNTRTYQNNIFHNARSNSGVGTGKHYAVRVGGTLPNPAGLTIDYNDYFADGTGGVLGFYNAVDVTSLPTWRAKVGQDIQSISGDPKFILPNGTSSTVDLHISSTDPSPVESVGLAIAGITDDFDEEMRSGLTPADMGADAGNFISVDISGPIINYTLLTNTPSTSNRLTSSFATITDASGVNTAPGTKPRLYYKKTSDGANTFNDNSSSTPGWKFAETTGSSSPFDFTIDYTLLNGGSVSAGDIIQYFVVAQDLFTPPNLSIISGTFASPPSSTALTSAAFPITETINSYIILPSVSGTKTVCASGCDYVSLTNAGGAFASINVAVVIGNLSLEIAGDLTEETGLHDLNEFASPYTIKIKPTGIGRTISGASTGSLITLNAADRVTIDGSLGSTVNSICPLVTASRDLTIKNLHVSTSSAVVWLQSSGTNGARDNTIKNTNIVGNSNVTTLYGLGSGSSSIHTSSMGNGNNNNSFINNNISKTQYGIYSRGASTTNKNSGTIIIQNLINAASPNNVARGGILVGYENNMSIDGNSIANMSTATFSDGFGISLGAAAVTVSTLLFGAEVTNTAITNNSIDNIRGASTYSTYGIFLAPTTSGTNVVTNNMISNVLANGTSGHFGGGIVIAGGIGGSTSVYHNTVRMSGSIVSGSGTGANFALAIGGTTPVVDIRNNILISIGSGGISPNRAIGLNYGSNTGNYVNLTSDNNDLYVSGGGGTPGLALTGGLSSSGVRTTLAAWQTETGRDGDSKNVSPVFHGSTLYIDEINTSNISNLNGTGEPLIVTGDIQCDPRGSFPDIGADQFAAPNFWTGALSTDWHVTGNWDDNNLPAPSSNVIIPFPLANNPRLSSVTAVNNINIMGSSKLTLNDFGLTINGTITGTGALVGSSSSHVRIDGTGTFGTLFFDQTIPGTTNLLNNLLINRSGGNVILGNALEIGGTLNLTNGILTNGANLTMLDNSSVNRVEGDVTDSPAYGSVSGVDVSYTGSQDVPAGANSSPLLTPSSGRLKDLLINLSDPSKTINSSSGSPISAKGDITITAGIFAPGNNLSLVGDWTNAGGFIPGSYDVMFKGLTAQTVSQTGTGNFYNLTVDNAAGLILNYDLTVDGMLSFVFGNIATGSNKVIITNTGIISRSSGHVNGILQKNIIASAGVSTKTFEIGDALNYTPVDLTFNSVTEAGNLIAKTTATDHPQLGSSTIATNNSVNRYWTLTNNGIILSSYDATFNFVSGDVDAGGDPLNFIVGKKNASWSYPTIGMKTSNSTQATGLSSFSDFAIGGLCPINTSCTITAIPSNNTYTGGVPTNIYLGYGPQAVTLNVTNPSSGGPYTYSWSGGILSNYGSANPVFTATTAGSFNFTVLVTNIYGCTTTCSISICVTDIRVPGSNGNNRKVYICHNEKTLSISVNAVSAHLGNHAGDRLGKCGELPCTIVTGMKQELVEEKIETEVKSLVVKVLPNPTSNYFLVSLETKDHSPVTISVMNSMGQLIDVNRSIQPGSIIQLGESYIAGIYYLHTIQGKTKTTVKLVKLN